MSVQESSVNSPDHLIEVHQQLWLERDRAANAVGLCVGGMILREELGQGDLPVFRFAVEGSKATADLVVTSQADYQAVLMSRPDSGSQAYCAVRRFSFGQGVSTAPALLSRKPTGPDLLLYEFDHETVQATNNRVTEWFAQRQVKHIRQVWSVVDGQELHAKEHFELVQPSGDYD